MRYIAAVVITAGIYFGSVFSGFGAGSTLSAQGGQSVWDGVYTEEQAKRGETAYQRACGACHGPDLSGGEMAPALADPQFRSNWDGVPVGDLFERIRVSMPQDNPGGLSRQQYADVLSFVLSRNNFPKGTTELSTKIEMLQPIMFKALKP